MEIVKDETATEVQNDVVQDTAQVEEKPDTRTAKEIELDKLLQHYYSGTFPYVLGNASDVKYLRNLLRDDVNWTGKDSLVYVNLVTGFNDLVNQIEKDSKVIEDNTLHLTNHQIQGLQYFLTKVEGKSFNAATKFVAVFQPLQATVKMLQDFEANLKKVAAEHEAEIQAKEQGIDVAKDTKEEVKS